jgi:hypothetical protein
MSDEIVISSSLSTPPVPVTVVIGWLDGEDESEFDCVERPALACESRVVEYWYHPTDKGVYPSSDAAILHRQGWIYSGRSVHLGFVYLSDDGPNSTIDFRQSKGSGVCMAIVPFGRDLDSAKRELKKALLDALTTGDTRRDHTNGSGKASP